MIQWPGAEARATKQLSFPVSEATQVDIESRNGAIKVITDPSLSDAAIEAVIVCRGVTQEEADERLAATELIVDDSTAGVLHIRPRFPEPKVGGDGASISLHLPSALSAKLKTSNGPVVVDGTLDPIQGDVDIKSSNSNLKVTMVKGLVKAGTTNGAIHVNQVAGDANLKTSNGSVTVTDAGGRVQADSSNGPIRIHLSDNQKGPVFADSSNSNVELVVAANFQGEIEADTSNGRIRVIDPNKRVTKEQIKRSSGEIEIGEGGEVSKLSTSNGAITIEVE